MCRLKMAVQNKGKLGRVILPFLERAGLRFDIVERQLVARCQNFPLDLLFVRHSDVGVIVEDAAADLGVIGSDVLAEQAFGVKHIMNLELAKSSLCLAVPENLGATQASDLNGKKIATNFPNLSKQYFEKLGLNVEIVRLRGSVEIAPVLEIAVGIVDLVATGTTLRQNRLKVIDKVMEAQGVLVAGKTLGDDQLKLVEELKFRFLSVIEARDKKLLVFNLPKASLEQLGSIGLGLDGPTVSEVRNGTVEMVDVQIVVEESESWGVMRKLKGIGASGILVMGIERLVS